MENMTNSAVKPRCKSGAEIPLWVARMITGKKLLPKEACFFLLVSPIWNQAEKRFDQSPELRAIMDQMGAVRADYRLDFDEEWEMGTEPPEYRALQEEHDRLYQKVHEETLRAFGEDGKADLYRDNPEEFDRLYCAGRAFFLEPRDLTVQHRAKEAVEKAFASGGVRDTLRAMAGQQAPGPDGAACAGDE